LIHGHQVGVSPSVQELLQWPEQFGLTFPVVGSDPAVVAELLSESGSFGIPYFIVLDHELRIRGGESGGFGSAAQLVEELLAEE
jgi:hypothetical protein